MAATIAGLAVVSCARQVPLGDDVHETLLVTERDDGSTVAVDDGERIQVTLEANQTTPYRWRLAKVPDAGIVDLVSSDYVPDAGSEQAPGTGGTSIWTFRAVGPGTTTIGLAYVEIGDDVPRRSDFSVTLEVLPVAELES